MNTLPDVSAEIFDFDDWKELGGGCYRDYTIMLTIEDEETYNFFLPGWAVAGFLRPGSHMDIDGSGLEIWGDSQPGGWSVCDSDGTFNGRPRVMPSHSDTIIQIEPGDNVGERVELLDVKMIPEWNKICSSHDKVIIREYKEALEEVISKALENVNLGMVYEGPEALDIFYDLEPIFDDFDAPVRFGNWNGAGPVIAWVDDDGDYQFRHWPNENDVHKVVKDVSSRIEREILERIDNLMDN